MQKGSIYKQNMLRVGLGKRLHVRHLDVERSKHVTVLAVRVGEKDSAASPAACSAAQQSRYVFLMEVNRAQLAQEQRVVGQLVVLWRRSQL